MKPTDEQLRQWAADQYGSDDVEIDETRMPSRGEDAGGAWVCAWVWVAFPDEEIDE
jgi:hypothetical protein